MIGFFPVYYIMQKNLSFFKFRQNFRPPGHPAHQALWAWARTRKSENKPENGWPEKAQSPKGGPTPDGLFCLLKFLFYRKFTLKSKLNFGKIPFLFQCEKINCPLLRVGAFKAQNLKNAGPTQTICKIFIAFFTSRSVLFLHFFFKKIHLFKFYYIKMLKS